MNKLIKILSIFSFAIISVIAIYHSFNEEKVNILSIGDDLSLGKTSFNTYENSYNNYLKDRVKSNYNDSFSYENLTYEEIYRKIYYDENVFFNGEYTNIKRAIKESNIIILTANNKKTFNKCNKNKRIVTEYLENTFESIVDIVDIITNVSASKIIVLSPYCYNYNIDISNHIDKYYIYKNVEFINLYNGLNTKPYYIPNKYYPYPSLEGHNYIYNEIIKRIT